MASNCLFLFLFCLIPLLWSSPKVEEDGNDWKTCCRIGRFTRSGSLSDLKPAFPTPAASTGRPPPPYFPAMDLHDDLQKSKKALRIADLINGSDRWTRSSVTVVQVGDALDRGGKFITMNDNHEVMNIDGDFRFVTKSGLDEFRVWANWFRVGNSIKSQYSGIAALRPEGPISTRFLSLNHTVMAVDDSVVVHGGVSSEYSPIVELGGGENNDEHFLPAIEFILSMTPTQNYVSICPISLVLCGYLGYYESVSLNWGWVECLVMSFENWKAHKWKEKRGENGGDEHSIGFLLEGCLKARDTKAELIKSPNALLLSCGDLSYLCAEPSGVQNCQVPWFASFAVVLGDFISVGNLMRVIKALIHCSNFWEIMKLVTVGLVQGSNNVYKYRLNQHLTKIWPCVNEAASELIKANVEPIMDQYRPVILSSLKFSQFTLGTVAPQFTGISIIKDGGVGGITMELEMNWDGDNGYGNAMNVKRTVKGFIRAGFAGINLEDQVSPKACGHTQGRKLDPTDWRRLLTHGILCSGSIFHRCVHYDGCGECPITGPQFKSKGQGIPLLF